MAKKNRRSVSARQIGERWLNADLSARRQGGRPVVALIAPGVPGRMLVLHEIDLAAIANGASVYLEDIG